MKMVVLDTKTTARAPGLVRPCVAGDWAAADNDQSEVWVLVPGAKEFVPLVGSSWRRTTAALIQIANCSRVYLASIVELANGDAIICMKLGVKEVEASGTPFAKCDWGLYAVRMTPKGVIVWNNRYAIHKGNGQVVADPKDPNKVWLIATNGTKWVLETGSGAVVQKTSVPMGASGEKCYSTSTSCCFVGYSATPSGVTRFGVDTKPIPWASKSAPGLGDMGSDTIYAKCISTWFRLKKLWVVAVHGGRLRYNMIKPRTGVAKWPITKPGDGGSATCEVRHAPSLFKIPDNVKTVGVAFVLKDTVLVQVLNNPSTVCAVGIGRWPVAQTVGKEVRVSYFNNGNFMTSRIDASAGLPI